MIQISDNTQQIQPSKIRRMFNKALEYDRVLSFTLGGNRILPPRQMWWRPGAGPSEKASPNIPKCGPAGSAPGYRPLSCAYRRVVLRSGEPDRSNAGAMGALFLALKVLLNPGDEVIVNEPCWTNYIQQIRMCGGVPVSVKTDAQRGFDLDVSAVAETITSKTKAIILNSPCNPTGAVASAETLSQLAKLAQERDLVVLADEVYKHILFDGRTYTGFATLPGMKERTLVIDSLSKTYAMTGWRIGYAAGPEELIRNMIKLQENVSACAATPCQVAAIEALEGSQDHLKYMVEQYRLRRDYVIQRIAEIPGLSCHTPAGTFYAFINISRLGMPCEEFAMKLLEEKQVVVVPGTAFGDFGEGYIRLSYATSMECLEQGLEALEEFVRAHAAQGDRA